MTHIVFFDALWQRIEQYLVMSSVPSDGLIYGVKCRILHYLEGPLEVMYRWGLTTHKPMIAYEAEDLISEDLLQDIQVELDHTTLDVGQRNHLDQNVISAERCNPRDPGKVALDSSEFIDDQ